MEWFRKYGVTLLVVALLAGAVVFLIVNGGEPKEELALPEGGTVEVTPNDEMRVRTAETDPVIDPATYTLAVTGMVERTQSFTFDELLAMQAEERLVDLPCVEGWTETALWKGTRLIPLLESAGVLEGADNVVFSSPGGYTTSLTLADIDETDPLLAYGANGEMLPHEQGFPLRLVVPDRLGYKWIKWVTSIEVISGEYEGYWESRGYSNEADASNR
ncbi:MAG: oxidoreductase [Actinobacteria bacterium]|jgi:DMSO/TMAO reductase YedYZ molybdopterin-dependent catalytic subunit|nr:MAG: oxidoreductase [Actinomycetota bacterium]